MSSEEIDNILKYINLKKKIPEEKLREWMCSNDVETLGAAYRIFDQFQNLISSMPEMGIVIRFHIGFFRKCILENPNGEYAENRYCAMYTLTDFYKKLRLDKSVPISFLKETRDMLSYIYINGDDETKKAIVDGALEHLFEDSEIIKEFDSWRNDKELRIAYQNALEWPKKTKHSRLG